MLSQVDQAFPSDRLPGRPAVIGEQGNDGIAQEIELAL